MFSFYTLITEAKHIFYKANLKVMFACLRLLNLERDRLLEDAAVSRRREEEQGERREESDFRRKEIEGLKVQLFTNINIRFTHIEYF